MKETKNLNGLVLVDKKKLGQMLDDLKADAETEKKTRWYRCNICGHLYMEIELTTNKDIGLICESCDRSMKKLDQEQEDIETMMREEKKSKALP